MERLDKVLANLGYGTRKELKKICRNGLVEVNGEIAKDSGMQVDPENDKIVINGEEIFYRKFIYLMMTFLLNIKILIRCKILLKMRV